jgi:hypothetical protein
MGGRSTKITADARWMNETRDRTALGPCIRRPTRPSSVGLDGFTCHTTLLVGSGTLVARADEQTFRSVWTASTKGGEWLGQHGRSSRESILSLSLNPDTRWHAIPRHKSRKLRRRNNRHPAGHPLPPAPVDPGVGSPPISRQQPSLIGTSCHALSSAPTRPWKRPTSRLIFPSSRSL